MNYEKMTTKETAGIVKRRADTQDEIERLSTVVKRGRFAHEADRNYWIAKIDRLREQITGLDWLLANAA